MIIMTEGEDHVVAVIGAIVVFFAIKHNKKALGTDDQRVHLQVVRLQEEHGNSKNAEVVVRSFCDDYTDYSALSSCCY